MSLELNPQQCLSQISGGAIEPLYYLWGDEEYLFGEVLEGLKAQLLESAEAAFNFDRFDAANATPSEILEVVHTVPFLAARRLVVVENAEALADTDALVEYCQAPHLETCLVFTAVKATKKKLHELLKRSAVLVRCQRLKGRALVKWISDSARHDGLKLTPEAATTLTDLAGDHLRQLRNELDKLGTHLGSGGSIGAEEVQQLVGDSRANTIFELIDAVSAGRLEAALRMLAKLVTARESLPGIVAMLGRHFRNLWKTQLLGDRRATAGLVASELGVPPFVARRYLEQAQRFSGAQLRHMLIQLFRADQDLKMSTIPATLVVEKLLLEFTLAGQKESAEGGQRMRG